MNLLIRFARYLVEFAFGAVVVAIALNVMYYLTVDGVRGAEPWLNTHELTILALAMTYPAYRAHRWLTSLLR